LKTFLGLGILTQGGFLMGGPKSKATKEEKLR